MTVEELTQIVTANSLGMAEHTKAMAEINRTQAENAKTIAQMLRNSLALHESIKSLEVTALSHDAQVEQLIENGNKLHEEMAELKQQFQAYLTTRQN